MVYSISVSAALLQNLVHRYEVAIGQRRELGEILTGEESGVAVDIELGAHGPGGAHDARDDLGGGPHRVGEHVAAVGEGGDRRVERLVRADVDKVGPDQIQRGIKGRHPDIAVAGELIDERDRDVAVVQSRDRRRELVARIEPAKLDLAADLIAGRIVSLSDDGRAGRVIRAAEVGPDDDVTAIVQGDDLAVVLAGEAGGHWGRLVRGIRC